MSSRPPENRFLAALPPDECARLTARMTDVVFGYKDLVYPAGGPIEHIYFPRTGLISAVVVMSDGASAEVATTGREGVLGAAAALGAGTSREQVFCQVHPAACRRWPVGEFVAEVGRGGVLRAAVFRYVRATMTASKQQTACNCLHPVDERCARWLLQCHDAAGSDEFSLTHEFLADMLGVRRATVSVAAGALQSAGLIAYRHGNIKVLNRAGLEGAACECYRVIRDAFAEGLASGAA